MTSPPSASALATKSSRSASGGGAGDVDEVREDVPDLQHYSARHDVDVHRQRHHEHAVQRGPHALRKPFHPLLVVPGADPEMVAGCVLHSGRQSELDVTRALLGLGWVQLATGSRTGPDRRDRWGSPSAFPSRVQSPLRMR